MSLKEVDIPSDRETKKRLTTEALSIAFCQLPDKILVSQNKLNLTLVLTSINYIRLTANYPKE
jgi:hypothetical protein